MRRIRMIFALDTFNFLRRAAKLYGEKIGVVDQERRFTYTQLLDRANCLAAATRSLGLAKSDVVSILDYNSHHLIESYYGLLRSGLVINPLNFRNSSEDVVYMINHARSKAVFVHHDFLPIVKSIEKSVPSIEHVVVVEETEADLVGSKYYSYEGLLKDHGRLSPPYEIDENDMAELLYTSGTTRRPKAVALTHRNLYLNALYTIIAYRLTDADVLLHSVPLFHSNGGGTPQTITAVGGKHVMLRKVDAEVMLELIEKESVTMFVAVPTVIRRILSHPKFKSFDASSMRRIIVIGAATTPDLVKSVEENLPDCECLSAYGMTETGPLVSLARPKSHERNLSPQDQMRLRCSTGYEVVGVEMRVVDGDMNDVPSDGKSKGEIVVHGNSIFNGYYGSEDCKAQTIASGWFRTGDVGVMQPGGWVTMVDRVKDMIKSGGENISSIEVEGTILAHPSVLDVAVVPVPDERWGEVPKALVLLKPGESVTEDELITYCRDKLAHFKAPKSVEFVESFPRSTTGKILKNRLRERFWRGHERTIG